jgi:hypothetical protein
LPHVGIEIDRKGYKAMTKSNKTIEQSEAKTFTVTTGLSERTFREAHGILANAYRERLLIERASQGTEFNVETFYADNDIAEQVINSASRTRKVDSDGAPILRKGKYVYSRSRFNQRTMQNAATVIRRHVISSKALSALLKNAGSIELAVNESDRLGSVLGMVARLNRAGLVANNAAGNDAKNEAIKAYVGETARVSAMRALLGSLAGRSIMTADIEKVKSAVSAWEVKQSESETAIEPLTFDGILGKVAKVSDKRAEKKATEQPRAERRTRASKATEPSKSEQAGFEADMSAATESDSKAA